MSALPPPGQSGVEPERAVDAMFSVAHIACCPEHGLHGQREECFVCGGAVEQVAVVPVEESLTLESRICLDCGGFARPGCDWQGHGVAPLADLIEAYH